MPAERLEAAVEPDLARLCVVLVDQRLGVVDEQRLRPSAEMRKRRLDPGEPRALALVSERARKPPARVAQRRHEQEHPHRLATDQHPRLAEVDLHLLARRGLEADRRTAARFKLLTEPSARALDRAQARLDPEFLAQLLTHHVAVAPVLQETLPQPRLMTAQHAVALRLPVGTGPPAFR